MICRTYNSTHKPVDIEWGSRIPTVNIYCKSSLYKTKQNDHSFPKRRVVVLIFKHVQTVNIL